MSEARIATPYQAPELRELGRLSVLTESMDSGLHFAQAAVGSISPTPVPPGAATPTPTTPTTPTQNVLDNTQSSTPTPAVPDTTSVKGDTDTSPEAPTPTPGASGTRGVEAGSNVVSGSDSLPFTGLELGPVAALGAGLVGAGATLRRWVSRA